jgi:hypothetical protein
MSAQSETGLGCRTAGSDLARGSRSATLAIEVSSARICDTRQIAGALTSVIVSGPGHSRPFYCGCDQDRGSIRSGTRCQLIKKREQRLRPVNAPGSLICKTRSAIASAVAALPGRFLPDLDRRRKPRGPFLQINLRILMDGKRLSGKPEKEQGAAFRNCSILNSGRATGRAHLLSLEFGPLDRTDALRCCTHALRGKHYGRTSTPVVHRSARSH